MGAACSSLNQLNEIILPENKTQQENGLTRKEKYKQDEKELMRNYKNAVIMHGILYASYIYARTQETHCNNKECKYNKRKRHIHKNEKIFVLKNSEIYCEKCDGIITLIKNKFVRNKITLALYSKTEISDHCDECCNTYINKIIRSVLYEQNKKYENYTIISTRCNNCFFY
jgi:hypothetical protein